MSLPGLGQLEATPEILRLLMEGLSEEDTQWKPAPNRFSIAETLEHLSHSEGHCFRDRVQRMVEEDKYCVDIMNQIAGVQAALEQVSVHLMENHLRHCVSEAILEGKGEEKILEMMDVIKHFSRS